MAQTQFPAARSDGYDISSKPIFLLTRTNKNGKKESEVLVMDAKMHVFADSPLMNRKTGRRQVDLVIRSWKAVGHSKLLDTEIVMELDNSEQKTDESNEVLRSTVVAKTSDADFPAHLSFNMAYRISAPALGYKSEGILRSTATGTITEFPPPSNARFEISGKEITAAGIDIDSLLCAC